MYIETLKKEVTIWVRTRKIQREINEAMLLWVEADWTMDLSKIRFPAINMERAEETMVKLLSWLTDDEMNELTEDEYLSLKVEIWKKK
jgi:hypothetical protein